MTGITAYYVYIPSRRVSADEYASGWNRMEADINAKAVPAYDEDIVTMGLDAAQPLTEKATREPALLTVASTTWPQPGTTTSGLFQKALGLPPSVRSFEFGTTWRAGIEALDIGIECDPALVVTADAPEAPPAASEEHILGSGAVAFMTGPEPVATLRCRASYTTARSPARFETEDGVQDLALGQYTSDGVTEAVEAVVDQLLENEELITDDISYAVLPQGNLKRARRLGNHLGFTEQQLSPGSVVEQIGFAGAAAAPIGLAATFHQCSPGDLVLVVDYADGHGANGLLFESTDQITDVTSNFRSQLNDCEQVSYLEYLKISERI